MKAYLILLVIALVLFGFFSKIIDFVRVLRVKKGLSKLIKIIINDNTTVILDKENNELFQEPNFVLIARRDKAVRFGASDTFNKAERKFHSKKLQKIDFINNFNQVERVVDDFWYQYITYYILKYKRENKIPSFTTVSVCIKINVSSRSLKEKIIRGINASARIKKPKFYNILDVR